MKQVEVLDLNLLSEKEGNCTYDFESIHSQKGRILAFRKKGSISGNHWHEGKSTTKNPEEMLIISGRLKLEWTDEPEGIYQHSKLIEAPALIRINPGIKHRVEALEDLCFLEFNSLAEHAADTLYPNHQEK
ncbi:hypothetical protein [Croceimicrobium hydrocarbonivorans]|uniref:Cupin n=1 Tax=Croceimicrobium hydrocarbonivorans TaxID=2761580 RepID=A0A7H0VJE1_9FLAO|nr:hypothetical protein [Croceimicrobium hydrocarbonivorans]QNR25839.1 hypothetical protein H4K34_08335 [Croceimicrobium hydrocarbonivorans]